MTDPKDDVNLEPELPEASDEELDNSTEGDAISTLDEENPPPPKDEEIPESERPA